MSNIRNTRNMVKSDRGEWGIGSVASLWRGGQSAGGKPLSSWRGHQEGLFAPDNYNRI